MKDKAALQRYWLFNNEMLERALAAYSARRQKEGASEKQAQNESRAALQFLASREVLEHGMRGS